MAGTNGTKKINPSGPVRNELKHIHKLSHALKILWTRKRQSCWCVIAILHQMGSGKLTDRRQTHSPKTRGNKRAKEESRDRHIKEKEITSRVDYSSFNILQMNGDKKFAYADWQAKLHLEYAPVFYYVFDYMSPDTWVPEFFGQCISEYSNR